ncbi:RNA-directed DNA polymerase, eukaryota, reverse transcriptase zinc-binding domain protein [Tanacetum coccineum]
MYKALPQKNISDKIAGQLTKIYLTSGSSTTPTMMCNNAFLDQFGNCYATFLPYFTSDHTPGLLTIPNANIRRKKSFRFMNYLADKKEFHNIIKDKWNEQVFGYAMFVLARRRKRMKKYLRSLNNKNGNVYEKVKILREELKKVQLELDKDPHNANLKEDEMNFLGTCDEVFPIKDLDSLFDKKLSGESALFMIRDIIDDEIKDTLRDINDNKAPGSDGFTSKFFKASWQTTGKDLCAAVKEFFSSGKMLGELNTTLNSLVLKCKNPMKVTDYRPIACCNVIYKCISKVITNRIKAFLNDLIDMNQSSFIKGRHISDNIMVAQELMYGYSRNKKIGNRMASLKLEGGLGKGIMRALDEFCLAFELRPNMAKSTVFYGNVKDEVKRDIEIVMPFSEGILHVKYLGIPLDSSRIFKNDCKVLIENVKKRIDDWRNKYLSFAGRLQHIDSVLSSLNVFWASIFILPEGRRWHRKDPLCKLVSQDLLMQHSLDLKIKVADLISNGSWSWPRGWNERYNETSQIQVPKIIENLKDKAVWINKNGKEKKFSVHEVWKSMKINSVKERNLRLFGDTRRTEDELFNIIFEIVRSRFMGLQLKVTPEVIKA